MHARRLRSTLWLVALALVATTGCSSNGSGGAASTTQPGATGGAGASTTTTLPAGVITPIASIQLGQCLNEVGDETARSFVAAVLPCEEPHTHEVYDVQSYGGAKPPKAGTAYPGDLVVANEAERQCATTFEAFMGIAWEASDFEIQAWWPTQRSWTEKNDRQVTCTVFKVTGGAQVGSVRGTRE